jgi:hypothetical protein
MIPKIKFIVQFTSRNSRDCFLIIQANLEIIFGSVLEDHRIVPGQFQQIGPPRNVSVRLAVDGYLVTWQPPEFGSNELRAYRVRWSQASREYICSSAETQDTSFLGELLIRSLDHLVVATNKTHGSEAS